MMIQRRRRVALKTLSPERQELIVCMHEKQFGAITNMPVVDGQPQLNQVKITRKHKLNGTSLQSPVSKNFRLKAAHLLLLDLLDEIRNGVVERVSFRDGLPCELENSTV